MPNDIVPFAELTKALAERFEVTPQEMINTVKMQCFPGGAATEGQLMMLLSFAKQYDLNPLARECFAFISGGKMQVGVMVDGWSKIANRQETFDGQEMEYERDKTGKLIAITSKTYVKNRKFPTIYRAVMTEWARNTEVWKSMPEHQLFVKARNEGIRFAFGVSSYDPDDIERIAAAQGTTIEVKAEKPKQIEKSEAVIADASDDAAAKTPELVDDENGAGTTAAASREQGASSNANADEQPRDDAPAQSDSPARARLDALIAKKVTAARLNLLLGQAGVEKVEDLSDEQVENLIKRLEKK